MGGTPDQIEREIAESRHQLHENFQELEDNVRAAMDWRSQFARRPSTMLVLAAGGGILTSAILPSRSRPRLNKANSEAVTPSTYGRPSHCGPSAAGSRPSDLRRSFEVMQAALRAVASKQASAFD
jgi:hypothetical protein